MSKLQEVFDRLQKTKKEQKDIKAMYRDALVNSARYQKTVEDLKALKEEKVKIEREIKEEFARDLDKLAVLQNEVKNDNQLLTDVVISQVSKGEKVEVKDEYGNPYEPIFSVRFRKSQ